MPHDLRPAASGLSFQLLFPTLIRSVSPRPESSVGVWRTQPLCSVALHRPKPPPETPSAPHFPSCSQKPTARGPDIRAGLHQVPLSPSSGAARPCRRVTLARVHPGLPAHGSSRRGSALRLRVPVRHNSDPRTSREDVPMKQGGPCLWVLTPNIIQGQSLSQNVSLV